MELKSFDTILTQLCDNFDVLITPKKIARSNTNIIYLLFKAIAKGYEVINNVCVVLSNKFNPAKCSEEDLVSVASLVGTERRSGSATGLHIVATNTGEGSATLLAGTYTYALNDDVIFEFEVIDDTVVGAGNSVSYIAMSSQIGRFPVTAQPDIEVKSVEDFNIPSDVAFSCTDNANLLGNEPESLLAFRQRILNTYDRQNSIVELEEYLRNLPYIFDCSVRYNQTNADVVEGSIVVPSMHCAIIVSGEIKNDIAEKVADYIVCPTVSTADSVEVRYTNPVFVGGYYAVNIIPFAKLLYTVDIIYRADTEYVNVYDAKEMLERALLSALVAEKHTDVVKEDDVYNVIESAGNTGLDILAVNLKVNGTPVDYVDVPVDKIAELSHVTFIEG